MEIKVISCLNKMSKIVVEKLKKYKCFICLAKTKFVATLVCDHQICKDCLLTLVTVRIRKCPYCRTRITDTISTINKIVILGTENTRPIR